MTLDSPAPTSELETEKDDLDSNRILLLPSFPLVLHPSPQQPLRMGISSIFKKKHSKSSSQSSSNDGGRRSLDSAGAHSPSSPSASNARDGGVVEVDHRSNPVASSHSPGNSSSSTDEGNRHSIVDFDPPQHSPPPPPPKDTTSAPTLPIPEFKAFSISSPSPSANGTSLSPPVPPKGTSTLPPSTPHEPFPLTIAHPPKTIPAPPTTFLVSDPPTISRGPINPSYLSHTESIFSSVPYSPTSHLAYHTSLFPPTSPSTALIKPSIVPHEQQRLDLAEKIKREHHPRKVGLDEKGEELFKKAGLEVKDREGKGTIDWEVTWAKPVVHEHVVVHEHRIYQTVVEREIHRYHVFPLIQPIVDNRPPSPSQELHYFRDSSNQWREIVGRDAAEEILRASGAQKSDETVSWVDDRAVRAERKELEDLVAGKERKDRIGRITEVGSGKGLVSGEHKKMIGDEKEQDGRAKVVRGVAL